MAATAHPPAAVLLVRCPTYPPASIKRSIEGIPRRLLDEFPEAKAHALRRHGALTEGWGSRRQRRPRILSQPYPSVVSVPPREGSDGCVRVTTTKRTPVLRALPRLGLLVGTGQKAIRPSEPTGPCGFRRAEDAHNQRRQALRKLNDRSCAPSCRSRLKSALPASAETSRGRPVLERWRFHPRTDHLALVPSRFTTIFTESPIAPFSTP